MKHARIITTQLSYAISISLAILFLECGVCLAQSSGGGNAVQSINNVSGPFTFSGSGVTCTGLNCVFSGGSGSGNTTSTNLTSNFLTRANGTNSIVNSGFSDNGTTGTYSGTGGFTTPSINTSIFNIGSWQWQPSTTAPTATSIEQISTSGVGTWITPSCFVGPQTQIINANCYATASSAAAAAVTQAQSSGLSQTIWLNPNTTYPVSSTIDITTTNRTCINIEGAPGGALPGNGNNAQLQWTGSAGGTVLQHTYSSSTATYGCTYRNFSINGNYSAAIDFSNVGQSDSLIDNVIFLNCHNTSTTSGCVVEGGNSNGANDYEYKMINSVVEMAGASANIATCGTPVITSGSLTSCTTITNSGGTGYHYPIGITNGCTTPPTWTFTTSGGFGNYVITGATPSGSSGCSASASAYFVDLGSAYGVYWDSTDGTRFADTVIGQGSNAGFYDRNGAGLGFVHDHCYLGQPMCIEDHGGSMYDDVEPDTMLQFDIGFYGYGTVVNSGHMVFNNSYTAVTGKSLFYFASSGQGSNQIWDYMGGVPTNGIAQPYAVGTTFYNEGDASGLPLGDNFCILSKVSLPNTSQQPTCYGTRFWTGQQEFSAGSVTAPSVGILDSSSDYDGLYQLNTGGDLAFAYHGSPSFAMRGSETADVVPYNYGLCWGTSSTFPVTYSTCIWEDASSTTSLPILDFGNTTVGSSGATVKVYQVVGSGATTIASGAGAGTSPTVSIAGTNLAGVVSVTTGTSPTASAILATISFHTTLSTAPQGCGLTGRNAVSAAALTAIYTTAPSTSSWTITVGSSALAASTAYQWSYSCF